MPSDLQRDLSHFESHTLRVHPSTSTATSDPWACDVRSTAIDGIPMLEGAKTELSGVPRVRTGSVRISSCFRSGIPPGYHLLEEPLVEFDPIFLEEGF